MPIDMPPQAPAYHIERAAPAPTSLFDTILAAAHRVSERKVSPAEKMLPRIDAKSQALTVADRNAILDGMTANWNGDLAKGGFALPKSYVGDRIALGIDYARMQANPERGNQDARAMRCRMVALSFDNRAGRYLVGGEAAAVAARRSIPAEVLEACRASVKTAAARTAPPVQTARVLAPVRIDPAVTTRVRIDLVPTPRKRIDLQPLHKATPTVKPVAFQMAQQSARGI